MLSEEVGSAMVCQESAQEVEEHPKRRGAHEWKGITLFVKENDSKEDGLAVVELPDGVYEVHVENLEERQRIRANEEDDQAYTLRLIHPHEQDEWQGTGPSTFQF